MSEVTEKIRSQLIARGGRTLGMLRRQFKIMDDNGDKRLDKDELYYGLQDFGLELTKNEVYQFM